VQEPQGWRQVLSSLDLRQLDGYEQLWQQLQAAAPQGLLPSHRLCAKLLYMDAAGDWLVVGPEQRWRSVVASAVRIGVCCMRM
jgi:hypothetical protein